MDSPFGVAAIALVCAATLGVGSLGLRLSRTTSDFYVAGRIVTAGWNASAVSGEYLSAASFLGIVGLLYAMGADMLWLPVGYTVGYLVLLTLVAAPLRRSGAYTIPDFAEMRLQSVKARRVASLLVVGIGWLYLLPQFQGAGLALATVTGAPVAAGSFLVAVVVLASVAAGGMRSITLVQAMQYWIKLAAIAIPAFVMAWVWFKGGAPLPTAVDDGGPFATVLPGFAAREHPVYTTYSTILALCLGTMGLPHVLVRFYTNPDGRAARRTTVIVIGLLGTFYLFPPIHGALARIYLPTLDQGGRSDSVLLLLPHAVTPGTLGDLLSAMLAGGAFAAFLSTASGLTVSVAGVIDQDLLSGALNRRLGLDLPRTHSFRLACVVAVAVPYAASWLTPSVTIADTVGLAFAIAASTLCPLLVLGVWWRGLSVTGAVAGLLVGGILAVGASSLTFFGWSGAAGGWMGALLGQPAAWTIPVAFATAIVVSLATRASIPRNAARSMVRLHSPEELNASPTHLP
ncbi:MAG: cation acetate symporter [Dermatophilaceae bacterium]